MKKLFVVHQVFGSKMFIQKISQKEEGISFLWQEVASIIFTISVRRVVKVRNFYGICRQVDISSRWHIENLFLMAFISKEPDCR